MSTHSQQRETTTLARFDAGSEDTSTTPDRSGSDEYGTPRQLIARLTDATDDGVFSLDPAAGAEDATTRIARKRYTKSDGGLKQTWTGQEIESIFCNPPYSDPEPFLQKLKLAVDPDDETAATYGIALTKADTSTQWFHDHLTKASFICFVEGRLTFAGGDNSAPFPNAIAAFGDPPESLIRTLDDIGALYSDIEIEAATEQQQLDDLFTADGGTISAIPTTSNTSSDTPFEIITPHDPVEITYTQNELITQSTAPPEEITLRLLPGGKSRDPASGSITLDMVGQTTSGEDICAQITTTPTMTNDIEVVIAKGMQHWTQITPVSIDIR
jgi:phage N-6-adenine-methyltransferase